MRFAKIKLYAVKTLRVAFTAVAWLDFYCVVTGTPIFGFTRTFGNLVADSVTAFLLYCWENKCYEEFCFMLAEDEMNKKVGKPKNNLYSIHGKKDDNNE